LDSARFEKLAQRAHEALNHGQSASAADQLRIGLRLWRGPAFGELASIPLIWCAAGRLEEMRIATLEELSALDLELGRHADVAIELPGLIAEHPFRDRLRAHLMLALYRSGRRVDALEHYQQARQLLRAELGLEPGHQLRSLHQAMLSADPRLDGAGIRELIG
jgi:DNA-binding SARP family transcriptional activator